jgi:hypothetical protein
MTDTTVTAGESRAVAARNQAIPGRYHNGAHGPDDRHGRTCPCGHRRSGARFAGMTDAAAKVQCNYSQPCLADP